MSNRRRPKIRPQHTHARPPEPGPGEAWCTQVGIVSNRHDPAQIQEAMQLTHDKLIDDLGPLRRSGGHWTQHYAAEGLRVYATLNADVAPITDPDALAQQARDDDECRKRLQDPNAMLIVAWVIAELPEGVFFDADGIKE